MDEIGTTCCFSGPRPKNYPWGNNKERESKIAEKLKIAVREAIERGYRHFISGMAAGIDMLAAKIVLQMREEEILKSYLDPAVHFDVLETLGKLGLPMQISEVTVPSYFRSEEANAEIQAFITEELYRLWFSVENMEGVDYWNLVDGYATGAKRGTCGGENYYGGGLLDFDMNEKPAYRALDRLINGEWKTTAGGNGVKDSFRFRGFFGTYEIEVRRQGRTEKFNLDLSDSGRYAAGKTAVRV